MEIRTSKPHTQKIYAGVTVRIKGARRLEWKIKQGEIV